MATITENQRRTFLSRAMDDARRLQNSLANLSDAQRAAILAIVAAKTSTPVDITLWADEDDREQVRSIVAGELRIFGRDPNAYQLGSGCLFQVVPAPGEEPPHHE